MIAISHYTAGDIAQRFNFDHDKLRIIQRGVDSISSTPTGCRRSA